MERLRFEFTGHMRDLILNRDRTVIGRSEEADVTIVTATMSRNHFEVVREDGEWMVRDLGSSNGSYLNGVKLGQPALHLKPGAVIKAGGLDFIFSPPVDDGGGKRGLLEVLDEKNEVLVSGPLFLAATIGRGDENDLVVDDAQVSTHHCAIEMRGATPMLRDLGSTNGTLFKGEKVSETALKDGDIFFLGLGLRVRLTMHVATGAVASQEAVAAAAEAATHRPTEHVPAAPAEIPGVPVASSFVLVLLFMAIGVGLAFGLPMVAGDDKKKGGGADLDTKVAPATTEALGFDELASGELGGWKVVEVRGGTAEAGLDKTGARQGAASLALKLSAPVTSVVLETNEPQELNLGHAGTLKAWVRGQASATTSVVVSAVFADGSSSLIGQGDLSRNNLTTWSQLSVPLRSIRRVGTVGLRIEFTGAASGLWVDGITVDAEGEAAPPSMSVVSGQVTGAVQDGPKIRFEGGPGRGPVDISAFSVTNDGGVNEGPWLQEKATSINGKLAVDWQSLRTKGTPIRCTMGLAPVSEPYAGLVADFRLFTDGAPGVKIRSTTGSNLVLHDYVGNPIPVKTPLTVPVGSVTGVSIGNLHITVSGANTIARVNAAGAGWEVLLSFVGTGGERAPTLKFEVFAQPVMDFHRHEKLVEEINRLAPEGHPMLTSLPYFGSAALERAKYLAALNGTLFPGMPAIGAAKVTEITARADAHWEAGSAAADKAREAARRGSMDEAKNWAAKALGPLNQLLREFPGHERIVDAANARDEMGRISAGGGAGPAPVNPSNPTSAIRSAPPEVPTNPELVQRAVDSAATLLTQAEAARKDGKWLLAHVIADNIAFNLHYTPSADKAAKLRDAIEADWKDEAKRNAWIAPRMSKIRDAAEKGERSELRTLAQEILGRYPYCEEAIELRSLLIAAGE